MVVFCTRCWAEADDSAQSCPRCGADQTLDTRAYSDKIISALDHPLPHARARVCWLAGEKGVREAVPRLIEVAENDPDLYVRKAALEALGILHDERAAALLQSVSRSNNRFLAGVARVGLEAGKRST
jgi:HEAT repeat protein